QSRSVPPLRLAGRAAFIRARLTYAIRRGGPTAFNPEAASRAEPMFMPSLTCDSHNDSRGERRAPTGGRPPEYCCSRTDKQRPRLCYRGPRSRRSEEQAGVKREVAVELC